MPTVYPEPGKAINAKEGSEKLRKYIELITDPAKQQHIANLLSRQNAFVFHRDHIDRFFKDTDNSKNATHFMVVLGIKNPKDPDIRNWIPTVIVYGCRKQEIDGEVFYHPLDEFRATRDLTGKLVDDGEELSEYPDGEKILIIESIEVPPPPTPGPTGIMPDSLITTFKLMSEK